MNDALRYGLVNLARCCGYGVDSGRLVARRNCLARDANDGLEFTLDGPVALLRLEVRLDSLNLRLDICHEWFP